MENSAIYCNISASYFLLGHQLRLPPNGRVYISGYKMQIYHLWGYYMKSYWNFETALNGILENCYVLKNSGFYVFVDKARKNRGLAGC